MGAWGPALFSDDVACDVRDHYRELLEDGVEDGEATRLTLEQFRAYLEEPDGIALLALAVTQSRLGRLDPSFVIGRWPCSIGAQISTSGSAIIQSSFPNVGRCSTKPALS